MPANLREVKDKIKSVNNTKKITTAMKLVASSKMKRFQDKALYTRQYFWDLLVILEKLIWDNTKHRYFEERDKGDTVFILYTSDKGLCGALNAQLIKTLFNSNQWNDTPGNHRKLIVLGKKGYNYCFYNKIKIDAHFASLTEDFGALEALHFVEVVLKYWNEHRCKNVLMVVPHYKNSLINYPVLKQYLPLSKSMLETHFGTTESGKKRLEEHRAKSTYYTPIYEPTEQRVFKRVVNHLLEVLFTEAFYELKASEYSSRMMAMQNATDAAGKIIERLTLERNKARQTKITQEIAELVGGSFTNIN